MADSSATYRWLFEVLASHLSELLAAADARAAGAPPDAGRLAACLADHLAHRLQQTAAVDVLTGGAPTGQSPEARIMRALRAEPHRSFTLDDLATVTGMPRETTAASVSTLVQEGSVVRDGYFVRMPGDEDELPPRSWDPDADERGGPDRRNGSPDRRNLGDRRLQDRRQA
jgi:hypothetical protein